MSELIEVRLPHMGVVERATLTAWHKVVGDTVAEGEPLCDVSTDKVDTEVASPASGRVVRLIVAVDEEIPVGAPIAQFADPEASDDEIAKLAVMGYEQPLRPDGPTPAATTPRAGGEGLLTPGAVAAHADTLGNRIPSSPLARRLAKEAQLDLSTVVATGAGGRIRRADIDAAIAKRDEGSATVPMAISTGASTTRTAQGSPVQGPLPVGYEDLPHTALAHSPTRRTIAEHMVRSVTTAPQITAQVDVDMSCVTRIREQLNAERAQPGRPKLSFLALIARATVAAVQAHPNLNATWTDTHLLRWHPVNLSIAVDADEGLVVPVIRNAERLSTAGLAETIADLSERARSRQLRADDMRAGTFTISNSGSVGGAISTPILNQPQVAALGVPAIVRQPVAVTAENGEEYVAIRPVMRLGLTFDHRAVDGAGALRALLAIQQNLETWPREAYE